MWDVGRRFANAGAWCTVEDYEDLLEEIHAAAGEAGEWRAAKERVLQSLIEDADQTGRAHNGLVIRLDEQRKEIDALSSRLAEHGKTLTNLGLTALKKQDVQPLGAPARPRISR